MSFSKYNKALYYIDEVTNLFDQINGICIDTHVNIFNLCSLKEFYEFLEPMIDSQVPSTVIFYRDYIPFNPRHGDKPDNGKIHTDLLKFNKENQYDVDCFILNYLDQFDKMCDVIEKSELPITFNSFMFELFLKKYSSEWYKEVEKYKTWNEVDEE